MQVNVSVDLREQNAGRENKDSFCLFGHVWQITVMSFMKVAVRWIFDLFLNVLLVPDLEELCLFSTGTYSVQLDSTFSIFY